MARRPTHKARWAALKGDYATAGDLYRLAGQLERALEMYRRGRMHRPAYDRQRPDLFADALRAAKGTLDPNGILNPGVLID